MKGNGNCNEHDADRLSGPICGCIQREIGGVGVGVECDRGGGQLWDSDVVVGVDAGSGSLHVRYRTVLRGPCLVRQGPPNHIYPCQRIRFSWYVTLSFLFSFFIKTRRRESATSLTMVMDHVNYVNS